MMGGSKRRQRPAIEDRPSPYVRSTELPERIKRSITIPARPRKEGPMLDAPREWEAAEKASRDGWDRLSKTIERVYRDIRSNQHVSDSHRKLTQVEVDAWYRDVHLPTWKRSGRRDPPGRDDDKHAAQEYFLVGRGLRTMVRDARDRLAPASWKRSGPNGRKAANSKK